jgi:hypothetical protein
MWQDCLSSEITFWVLLVFDIVLAVFMIYGFVLYINEEKKYYRIHKERDAYLKYLETLKK